MNQNNTLSKERILELISQEDLMQRYLGIKVDRRKRYLSPFRPDKKPDCSFYYRSDGMLVFKDWAAGESYDCFAVIMRQYLCNFWDALKIIDQDYGLGLYTGYVDNLRLDRLSKRILKLETPEIQKYNFSCSVQEFSPANYSYWEDYEISIETLKKFSVYDVTDVRKNGKPYMRGTLNNPIFGYFFDDTSSVKFYRPLTEANDKWRGNNTAEDINGLAQLPEKGEMLIITKSLKDVMVFYEMGINAIAPQSENGVFPEKLTAELKERFSSIYILFDNDAPGIEAAQKFSYLHQIPYFILEEAKDMSDLVKLKSLSYARQVFYARYDNAIISDKVF